MKCIHGVRIGHLCYACISDENREKREKAAQPPPVNELTLRMQYVGACALLARLSNRPDMSADDRTCVKAALDDCVKLLPTLRLVGTGRGWSLEPKT